MLTEAEQIALMLEQIGRQSLAHCSAYSEEAIHWSPPVPDAPSLFALATLIIEEVDKWILTPVGGKVATHTQAVERPSSDTYAELALRYEQWIENVQKVLSILPNSFMDLYVEDTHLQSDIKPLNEGRISIRTCILTALEHCSVILGRMQGLRALLGDREHLLQKVEDRKQELS